MGYTFCKPARPRRSIMLAVCVIVTFAIFRVSRLDFQRYSKAEFLYRPVTAIRTNQTYIRTVISKAGIGYNSTSTHPRQTASLSNALVLYAKQRTGSTFASRFLAGDPDVNYLYEPLNQIQHSFINVEGKNLLHQFLKCNFSAALTHPNSLSHREEWLSRIFCMFPDVKKMTADCGRPFRPDILQTDCAKFPYITAKIITLPHISHLSDMLGQGLKVWALFRDPRGVLSSRKGISKYKLGQTTLSNDAEKYCAVSIQDIQWIRKHNEKENKSVSILPVRYEDLALQPHHEIRRLYGFWNRSIPQTVISWADTVATPKQKNGMGGDRFGVYRPDSAATAWHWRTLLPLSDVITVQNICGEFMDIMGYRKVHSESQLLDTSFTLMGDINWEVVLFPN